MGKRRNTIFVGFYRLAVRYICPIGGQTFHGMEAFLMPTTRDEMRAAILHVSALRGFYIHLAVFGAAIALLVVINTFTKGDWWVFWVIGGWGIGVVAHAVGLFAPPITLWGRDWERRKIRQRLGRE
jgi:hypothetical protein